MIIYLRPLIACLAVGLLAGWSGAAYGIEIRNDLDSTISLELADQPQFSATGTVAISVDFGTGTVIAPNWVLTAKHVVTSDGGIPTPPANSVTFTTAGGGAVTSDAVYIDPNSDMALVHFATPFPSSVAIIAPNVPGSGLNVDNQFVWSVGYGDYGIYPQSPAELHPPDGTRHAGSNITDQNSGQFLGFDNDNTSGTEFEASTAPGDSGGPLMQQTGYQWHVVAEVLGAGAGGFIDTRTDTDSFITDTTGLTFNPQAAPTSLTWNSLYLSTSGNANTNTLVTSDGGGIWDTQRLNFAGAGFTFSWENGTTLPVTFGVGDGAAGTVTLGEDITVGDITFDAPGSGEYTIAGGGFTLNLINAGSTITSNVDSIISAPLVGTTLTKMGEATLTLSGTGTMLDEMDVNEGTVDIAGGSATFADRVQVTTSLVQDGGTVTIGTGAPVDLESAATLSLNGGIFQVGGDGVTTGIVGPGTLALGGGTLQPTAANLTIGEDATLTGSTILDVGNGSATINGEWSGDGALVIDDANVNGHTVTFSGSQATYTGGTTVNGGSLEGTLETLATDGPLTINAGGTVDLGDSAATQFNGVLSGTGTLNVVQSQLELTNEVDFTGALNLPTNGTLEVFDGTLGGVNGTGSTVVVGGDTDAALSGTVNFVGNANTFPNLTINPNFEVLATSLPGTSVINHGALGSNAPFPSTPGTATLTLNNLTSTNALLLRTDAASGATDVFDVTGTANLSGTVVLTSGMQRARSYPNPILTAGTLQIDQALLNTMTPGGLYIDSGSALFTARLVDNGNSLSLAVTQGLTAPFARTSNELAVAHAIDPVLNNPPAVFGPVLDALNNLSAAQIPGALDQLTPEIYAYQREIAFENATFLVQQMDHAMSNMHFGTGLDTSGLNFINPGFSGSIGQSLLALQSAPVSTSYGSPPDYDPSQPLGAGGSARLGSESDSNEVQSDVEPNPAFNPQPPRPGVDFGSFVSGDVVLADLNQSHSPGSSANPDHASYTAGDITAGVAYKITAHLSTGALFNYNHTDARVDDHGSRIKVDTYSPGGFLTFAEKGFYANGLFTFGYNSYGDERHLSFGGLNPTASSSPKGQQYVGNLDGGYNFHPDKPKQWTLGPTLGGTYTHVDVDEFSETGAGGANLHVSSQSADSLRSRLGAMVSYRAISGAMTFEPTISAEWQHEFLDPISGISSSLATPGTGSFTINTAAPARDSALFSIGLQATIHQAMVIYFNYLANVNPNDYVVQGFQGGIKTSF